MDLQSFAEEDFDPKKWINRAWSSCGNQEKEVFVGNTVTRLQLYMKQLTNSLDETTTQIVTSVPKILQDASSLQLEGALLHQRLMSLGQKVQEVEEQTGHSIQSLQKIDQLKSRLESSASALREADKWAAQVTSLEAILENGVPTDSVKLTELIELATAMTNSLEVLIDAPDYDKKRLQLETLYNRLEAAVTPTMLDVFIAMDQGGAAPYVQLLFGMRRRSSLCRSARRAAAAASAAAWRSQPAHTPELLLRMLADKGSKQVEWFASVIKSDTPLAEMVRVYTDLLLSLEPSPTKIVSANLKLCSSTDEGLNLLIDLRREIDQFVASIRGVIESPAYCKERVDEATLRQLGRAAYAPLKESLSAATRLVTRYLTELLPAEEQLEDPVSQSRALLSIADQCESWLSSSYNKAASIAGAGACVCYSPAVESLISTILGRISAHHRRIQSDFLSSVTNGRNTGVLSNAFPAALLLETTIIQLLDVLASNLATSSSAEKLDKVHPLEDLPSLMLDVQTCNKLPSMRIEPVPSVAGLRQMKLSVNNLARSILMQPLHAQLDKIPTLSVWCNNDAITTDLPDFALSPQEYITEIGQYLMTLPQHLELHLSDKHSPLQFLAEVCKHTCDTYAEKILTIRNMDELGTKRCLTDIVYLSSVVEDLGSNVTSSLKNLERSLRAATPAQNE